MLCEKDFPMKRYGISVRLVEEDDAEFILKLRTNRKLSRYLHKTDADIEKQIQWIRNYKKRELEGTEYYFLFYNDLQKIGVSRISDIKDTNASEGSWICDPSCNYEDIIATSLFGSDIFFEVLELETNIFTVSKGNNSVLKYHRKRGSEVMKETDIEYTLRLDKQNYLKNRERIIKLLNL